MRRLLPCLLLIWVSWTAAAEPPAPRQPSLLVTAAMERAEAALRQGDSGLAVRLLESELGRAQGEQAFLLLLGDAYRQHVARLQQEGRPDLAAKFQERLDRLSGPPAPRIANGPRDEPAAAGDPRAAADQHFTQRQYETACRLYQLASERQLDLSALARERWAYCKLHEVTRRLNEAATLPPPEAAALDREVRQAMALAPRLEYARTLLAALAERSRSLSADLAPARPAPAIRHGQASGGWQVSSSTHFRVHHHNAELAEQVLTIAERTREAAASKWLGRPLPAWPMVCDIYVHPSASAYSQATGAPSDSPGHSSIGAERTDATRIHSLRVDVRADHAHMLSAVLPHEVTHVVLAGQAGPQPLPRWADEGMAVLSETYERIGRHLTPLSQFYSEGRAFSAIELLTLNDYPEPGRMGSFYGQSACLVQYLSELRGPAEVIEFLKSQARVGPEEALQQHYGLTASELDQRLRRFILVEKTPSLSLH